MIDAHAQGSRIREFLHEVASLEIRGGCGLAAPAVSPAGVPTPTGRRDGGLLDVAASSSRAHVPIAGVVLPRSGVLSGRFAVVRSALGLIALLAAVALAVHVGFGVGLPNGSRISAAEARGLTIPRPPVINQAASAACLRAASAVSGVRSTGDEVQVRFAGQPGVMTIQYLASTRAAARYADAHPDPLADDVWANTNWFHTPPHLTHAVLSTLGRCLPMDHTTPARGFAASLSAARP